MQNLGAFEAVEPGGRGNAVGADVFRVEEVPDLQVRRELLRERDLVEAVAGRADDGADLRAAGLARVEIRNPMVVDDAGEGLIDAVVDVVEDLAVPPGL